MKFWKDKMLLFFYFAYARWYLNFF